MKQVLFGVQTNVESLAHKVITDEELTSFEVNELIDELVNIRVYERTPKDLIDPR